ncbi:MAG: isochorismate synthase [Dehalococcoidia bacterium]
MTAPADVALEAALEEVTRTPADAFRGVPLPETFDARRLFSGSAAREIVASYERPHLGVALIGVGEAGRMALERGAGIEDARSGAAVLLGAPLTSGPNELRPRLLGGFAFDGEGERHAPWEDYGSGSLVLPRMLFVREGTMRGVVLAPGVSADELATCLGGESEEDLRATLPPRRIRGIDRDAWLAGVRSIVSQVREGAIDKAVLATTQELLAAAPFDVGRVLSKLRALYPECHVFSIRAGNSTFLGASPELLVSLRDGLASALGLAGSARRGDTPDEDERLGRGLLSSAKDRREHATTVDAIREALSGVTEQLLAPDQPQLRRLRNIQHLATEIAGRALPGVDVLELVRRLHPTPAVCGWPREAARRAIAAIERFDRGWYAGPVGWLDGRGEGEFAVALRSALVRLDHAWLFAGSGIMGDSVPEAELAEVQLKFRPLTEALGGTSI